MCIPSKVSSFVHTIEFFSKESEEDREVDGSFTLSQHGVQFLVAYIQFSLDRQKEQVGYKGQAYYWLKDKPFFFFLNDESVKNQRLCVCCVFNSFFILKGVVSERKIQLQWREPLNVRS